VAILERHTGILARARTRTVRLRPNALWVGMAGPHATVHAARNTSSHFTGSCWSNTGLSCERPPRLTICAVALAEFRPPHTPVNYQAHIWNDVTLVKQAYIHVRDDLGC
jgi:hypothetical protein